MYEGPWAGQSKDRRLRPVRRAVVTSRALHQWASAPGSGSTSLHWLPHAHTRMHPHSRIPLLSSLGSPSVHPLPSGAVWVRRGLGT